MPSKVIPGAFSGFPAPSAGQFKAEGSGAGKDIETALLSSQKG
jgi:hypothetical protein